MCSWRVGLPVGDWGGCILHSLIGESLPPADTEKGKKKALLQDRLNVAVQGEVAFI